MTEIVLFAIFPPFDTICVLVSLITCGLAVVTLTRQKSDTPTAAKKPIPWGWVGLFFFGYVLLMVGLLLLGHWVDPSDPEPYKKMK